MDAKKDDTSDFHKHKIVPDFLHSAPPELLQITYKDGKNVTQGNELTPRQVRSQPTVNWKADAKIFYTLVMSDPDAPSRKNPKFREYLHWLVGNIPGKNIDKGDVICEYAGSTPPKDTGLHRYVFLLFKHEPKVQFKEPFILNNSGTNRPKFNVHKFAEKYNLGDPVAGNFFQAQWDNEVQGEH